METFTTPAKTRVVVYNPVDLVNLTTDGGASTTVELLPRGSEGEALAQDATITHGEVDGVSVITITLPNPRSFSRRRSGLDVRISAPEDVDVVIATNGAERSLISMARGFTGEVRLHGRVGDVDVAVPGGDLSAQVVSGTLSVKTASGDISVDRVDGWVKIRAVSGDVSIVEANGDASLTLVSGDVSISSAARSLDVTSVSGDVEVGDARDGASVKSTSGDVVVRRAWSGAIRAATVSGDVLIGVPPGRGVSVEARSMSGDLNSEIDLSGDRSAGSNQADADEGDGGDAFVAITANSVSGDVSIQRAVGASA
jgi:Putative adhesin